MAATLLDPEAKELVVPSDLEIFEKIPTDLSIQGNDEVGYKPTALVRTDAGTLEFNIPGNSEDYIKPSLTYMTAILKITRDNDTDLQATDTVAFENDAGHTVFSGLQVEVGNQIIDREMAYGHSANVKLLLSYGSDAQAHLTQSLHYKYVGGRMNAYYMTVAEQAAAATDAAREWLTAN